MKNMKKVLYYVRMILFVLSLIFIFSAIKTFTKVGLWGYIFFIIEFIYIILMILTLLSHDKRYKNDISFNVMHIGAYLYQIIVSIKTFQFKMSTALIDSYLFYRNNCIIMIALLISLICYIVLHGALHGMEQLIILSYKNQV